MAGAILILGAGAMAKAMAAALVPLASATNPLFGEVILWARRSEAADELGRETGARAIEGLAEAATLELEAILFCVRDGAISDLAMRLAEAWPKTSRANLPVALHTSGYHGIEVLASLASLGIERGGLHPVVSIAGLASEAGAMFHRVRFGVAGDPEALDFARELCVALGGVPLEVPDEGRALYHAAAALLSGGTVALFAEAQAALGEAMPNAEPGELAELVRELLRSTVANLDVTPPASALTGPVARGDSAVVEGHLASFAASRTPERAALYQELVAAMRRLLETEK